MIDIIDYKMGNLHSVKNALDKLGYESIISSDAADVKSADKLILPGVGAFPDAMALLGESGLASEIETECKNGKPLLGICLGMKILFEKSYEFGCTDGLGLIPGEVIPIDGHGLKIPHIGWNSLSLLNPCDTLVKGMRDGEYVYFVHSYRADTDKQNTVCSTFYGEEIPALVKSPSLNVWGAQFHPEKSHDTGLAILKRFAEQ